MTDVLLNVNVIQSIDDFFTKIFSSLKEAITWNTFWTLIAGIVIGFVICSTIYGILLMNSISKKEKEIENTKKDIDDDKISNIVEQIKNSYVEESEGLSVTSRFDILGKKIIEIVNKISSEYYPESKYPIYELTIEELILFMHYLSNRIGDIFDKPLLAPFKKISIAQIFKILDTKKKIEETKAAKAFKKANAGKVSSIIMGGLKYANPVYWVKKLFVGSTINFASRKISLLIIDIVADETNKTYSKSIFNKERRLKQLEIETSLKELEREELDA